MNTYIYPANLKESAKLWFWSLRDVMIGGAALLLSVISLSQAGFVFPLAITLLYAFLTIKMDDTSILDFIKRAANYFILSQQLYIWNLINRKGEPHEKRQVKQ